MKLRLPRTLFARLMLIWLLGFLIVLAISLALLSGERSRHDRDLLFEGIAREIAGAVDVLEKLNSQERAAWIETLGRQRLRFSLRPPPVHTRSLAQHRPLVMALERALPARQVQVLIPSSHEDHVQHGRLLISLRLADGAPLLVRIPPPPLNQALPLPPERVVAALIALISGVALLAWLAVRLATRPLSRLAAAATAIGEDPGRPPLAIQGPAEVTAAAAALNQMQTRIREYVSERTRILAAITHDLQTPITRLRLRAELLDDEKLRERIQADLDAMQALVREGLDYARSLDATEALQAVDLDNLLAALAEDAHDMGWQVHVTGHCTTPSLSQPRALRRALWNLIENGVKFGERVGLTIEEYQDAHLIRVRDHGPGLAEAELEQVFEPFYRTETSRNRDTGGSGLGLAIARNLLARQHATVSLRNVEQGGLEAVVRLPRAPSDQSASTA